MPYNLSTRGLPAALWEEPPSCLWEDSTYQMHGVCTALPLLACRSPEQPCNWDRGRGLVPSVLPSSPSSPDREKGFQLHNLARLAWRQTPMGLSGVCSPQRTRCPSPGPSVAQGGDKAEPEQGREKLGRWKRGEPWGWTIGTPGDSPAGTREQGSGSGVLPISSSCVASFCPPPLTPAPHGTPYKVT